MHCHVQSCCQDTSLAGHDQVWVHVQIHSILLHDLLPLGICFQSEVVLIKEEGDIDVL